jgi:hypothetical protein
MFGLITPDEGFRNPVGSGFDAAVMEFSRNLGHVPL